ncbi:MAG: hypothetical protein F4X40_06355 [Chloroflexi bacterium]|nr:hypothetical protein [Chloroflexota bacterium]
MSTSVIQNSDVALGELMRTELNGADKFCAASAFLNSGGLGAVFPAVERILEGEGAVSIVHGADFRITDPRAISSLVKLNDHYARMIYRVHLGWDLSQSHRFHPKLYFWTADYSSYTAVVGSSNLTNGGLFSNTEVNSIIRGNADEGPIAQCLGIFDGILAHSSLITPNEEFAEKYSELYERATDYPVKTQPPEDLQDLYRELQTLTIEPSGPDWQPRTQLEFVVKALQILESRQTDPNVIRDSAVDFVHLRDIYAEVERLAREADADYDFSAIETSIRGRINENIGNPPRTGAYFIRAGGMSGQYRLSDAGWSMIRERCDTQTGSNH